MERIAFASRPALNRPMGSLREAPLKKLTFTCPLKAEAAQTRPSWAQTGVPHFHSSAIPGDALRTMFRILASTGPRQSSCDVMYAVMRFEESDLEGVEVFFM